MGCLIITLPISALDVRFEGETARVCVRALSVWNNIIVLPESSAKLS